LSLRDGGPLDAAALQHAEQCDVCARELARLRATQAALKSLPQIKAPAYDPVAIRNRANRSYPYSIVSMATAAGVGTIAIMLAVSIGLKHEPTTVTAASSMVAIEHSASPDPEVRELVVRSQELESYLQRLPRRPRIERASTSITIDSLQDSIQWVDYQLSLADDVGMTERQAARLWQDRVQLMDSLVTVRYAEAQRAAYLIPTSGSAQ